MVIQKLLEFVKDTSRTHNRKRQTCATQKYMTQSIFTSLQNLFGFVSHFLLRKLNHSAIYIVLQKFSDTVI